MNVNETILQEWIAQFRVAWEADQKKDASYGYTMPGHIAEHRRRVERAKRLLTVDHIATLTEAELRELLADTDALSFWRDRKRKLDEILTTEGIKNIIAAFTDLIPAAEQGLTAKDLRHAIDAMRGLGMLAVSELLCYRFPSRYWTYSPNVTLPAFKRLGLDIKAALPHGQKNDLQIYFALHKPITQVTNGLQTVGFPDPDYPLADIFLWWVSQRDELPLDKLKQIPEIQITSTNSLLTLDLRDYLTAHGFHFPLELLTTYYLSLQTKPFVILTGISGTGKTKLAQLFAEWMSPTVEEHAMIIESPRDDSESFYLQVKPYYLTGNGFVIPQSAYQYFDLPRLGETRSITVQLGETGQMVDCSLRNQSHPNGTAYIYFFAKKSVKDWLRLNFDTGDILRFRVIEEERVFRLEKFEQISQKVIKRTPIPRYVFLSVRPDWTDNRGLLGFYNLITRTYQTTDFLRLLVQATITPDTPYFVILDEMNLAKVEYYFADFLSVLESRYVQEDGKIKQEMLRLHDLPRCVLAQGEMAWDEETELAEREVSMMCRVRCEGCPLRPGVDEQQWSRGQSNYDEARQAGFDPAHYVPPRLAVPINVYFSGTVNVDETTYMFSSKVLDRANTIEFNEVRLDTYFDQELTNNNPSTADDATRRQFIHDGSFIRLPKSIPELRTDLELAPYRQRLSELNALLSEYTMHFGYRVADEVLLYLWHAKALGVPDFDLNTAFDYQIYQKVLPKFHGSQAKLQKPLTDLIAFCEAGSYIQSVRKIRQMLDLLNKEGFASFA